jgi:hypothetical protein
MFKNIFKFGEIMAKKAKKAAKKAVKNVEVLAPPVTPKAAASSVDVRKHIEEVSGLRRDAATVWEVIKNDNHSDDDIRVIVKSLKFDTLLGEIS